MTPKPRPPRQHLQQTISLKNDRVRLATDRELPTRGVQMTHRPRYRWLIVQAKLADARAARARFQDAQRFGPKAPARSQGAALPGAGPNSSGTFSGADMQPASDHNKLESTHIKCDPQAATDGG